MWFECVPAHVCKCYNVICISIMLLLLVQTRQAEALCRYAVRVGRQPGVYSSWEECHQQVHKFPGAGACLCGMHGKAQRTALHCVLMDIQPLTARMSLARCCADASVVDAYALYVEPGLLGCRRVRQAGAESMICPSSTVIAREIFCAAFKGFGTYAEARSYASEQLGVAQQPFKQQGHSKQSSSAAQRVAEHANENVNSHNGGTAGASPLAAGYMEVVRKLCGERHMQRHCQQVACFTAHLTMPAQLSNFTLVAPRLHPADPRQAPVAL